MRITFPILLIFASFIIGCTKEKQPVEYVNPFIGTANSVRPSIWEANGGTYPGAVLPFGMVQVTPDDYHYNSLHIKSFTLLDHVSGYPKGSKGNFHIMPFVGDINSGEETYSRFSHENEKASPGYYSVFLDDYSIQAEMTVTEYAAFFSFNFLGSGNPGIVVSGIGNPKIDKNGYLTGICNGYYFCLMVSVESHQLSIEDSQVVIRFPNAQMDNVMIKVGFSYNGIEQAEANLQYTISGWDFARVKQNARETWETQLNRIRVEGKNEENKEIFYTAFYHSFLAPHIISDYGDPKRYSGLSPWDTYKCKQPLIALLEKNTQADMIKSVLEQYDKDGKMDAGPMTGVHNVPIIVDSYFKAIQNFDIGKAYEAMKASLMESPFGRENIKDFIEYKYVPSEIGYSVTKTLEYAFDYWAMAQMAKELNYTGDYNLLIERSRYYSNIFNPDTKFMTAKSMSGEWRKGGYREGDKWAYNWTTVHDIQGLINLTGGKCEFVELLDSCFQNGNYFHDNEPPLQNAYLYCYAGQPWKTQETVREIMQLDYSTVPGGLSGNDDLGALSAWYVFSAMGFYPVCPGRPEYVFGSPIFDKVTIIPEGGEPFIIEAKNVSQKNKYIHSTKLNGDTCKNLWINHKAIMRGGMLQFEMGELPQKRIIEDRYLPASETKDIPDFRINNWELSTNVTKADEVVEIKVDIQNRSSSVGSFPVNVFLENSLFATHWFKIDPGEKTTKTVSARFYEPGVFNLSINNQAVKQIEVKSGVKATFAYRDFSLPSPPVVHVNDPVCIKVKVKNVGSFKGEEEVVLVQNNISSGKQKAVLNPGEEKVITFKQRYDSAGYFDIQIGNGKTEKLLVYDDHFPSTRIQGRQLNPIMSYAFDETNTTKIRDLSENQNDAVVIGEVEWVDGIFGKAIKTNAAKNAYVEIPDISAYDKIADGKVMSILLWVYPKDEKNFADIISKGDLNVIQIRASNTEVNYYSGGYQRGEAYTLLPENWNRSWHHIAGVSDGEYLTLYIDGKCVVKKILEDKQNYTGTTNNLWNIGRNAANPDRAFDGYIDHVMVFDRALKENEIKNIMLFYDDKSR